MGKWDKFRLRLLGKQADNNIDFADLCGYVERIGFIGHPENGDSHKVYGKEGVTEIINLQPDGDVAKAYQVRQVRALIIKYGL